MATYFSNHSQSRFLANSNPASSTTNNTTGPAATPSAVTNNHQPGVSPSGQKLRLASSKHFSTTVSTGASDEKGLVKDKGGILGGAVVDGSEGLNIDVHPLRNTWVFWFRQQRSPGNKIVNYEEGIKKISAFSSVESFWSLWTHLNTPSALLPTTDYLLFHSGIRRPVWEDPLNITGGKWIIRLKKGVADRLWEDLILAIIGDQFADCDRGADFNGSAPDVDSITPKGNWDDGSELSDGEGEGGTWPEICGCTISVRQSEDIVSIWNRLDGDKKVQERIRDTIRKVLNLPPSTVMEYKSNNDSMQDKSSFRNSAIDRVPVP